MIEQLPVPLPVAAPFRNAHMTVAEYEAERTKLRETYGDSSREASAKRDQALALLFYRSGWSQQELAIKEDMSQSRACHRLIFGRFLTFMNRDIKFNSVPNKITEHTFRHVWRQAIPSEKNERIRFETAAKILLDCSGSPPEGPSAILTKKTVRKLADGKWHDTKTISALLDVSEGDAILAIGTLLQRGSPNCCCERKQVGKNFQYRLFPKDHQVSSVELAEKLGPIIKELKAEGKKNMATMSPATVAHLAGKLQQQLDEWSAVADASNKGNEAPAFLRALE